MNTFGRHLLVEYHGCDAEILNDFSKVQQLMVRAAEAAGATVVSKAFHRFTPQGVSGVVVIEESHLSIHTWPEYGYAAVDFYTCGDCVPERAHELLRRELGSDRAEVMKVQRGRNAAGPVRAPTAAPAMTVEKHYREDRADYDTDFVKQAIAS